MISRRQMMKAFAMSPFLAAPEFLQRIAAAAPDTTASVTPPAAGSSSTSGVIIRQIMTQPLPSLGNHLGAVVTVDYAPGAASPPHLHPGPVFGYVLEGTVEIGVDPLAPITYRAGDMWYEPPRHTHRVARNASSIEPARILAFVILDHGEPLVEPLRSN
jgi:quercetin dioxygenase-like cupin family protein